MRATRTCPEPVLRSSLLSRNGVEIQTRRERRPREGCESRANEDAERGSSRHSSSSSSSTVNRFGSRAVQMRGSHKVLSIREGAMLPAWVQTSEKSARSRPRLGLGDEREEGSGKACDRPRWKEASFGWKALVSTQGQDTVQRVQTNLTKTTQLCASTAFTYILPEEASRYSAFIGRLGSLWTDSGTARSRFDESTALHH